MRKHSNALASFGAGLLMVGCATLPRVSVATELPVGAPIEIHDMETMQSASGLKIVADVRRRAPDVDMLWGHVHMTVEFIDGRPPATIDVFDQCIPLRGISATRIRATFRSVRSSEVARLTIAFTRQSD